MLESLLGTKSRLGDGGIFLRVLAMSMDQVKRGEDMHDHLSNNFDIHALALFMF